MLKHFNSYMLISLLLCFVTSFCFASVKQKNVLVLHSYDPGYEWTSDFQKPTP